MRSERDVLVRLGRAISRRRQAADLTQEDLADQSGLHRTYIGGIERGERNPTVASLRAIASGLNCSISDLFRDARL